MKIEADRAHGRLEGCPFCAGGAGHGWLGLMEFMVGGGSRGVRGLGLWSSAGGGVGWNWGGTLGGSVERKRGCSTKDETGILVAEMGLGEGGAMEWDITGGRGAGGHRTPERAGLGTGWLP